MCLILYRHFAESDTVLGTEITLEIAGLTLDWAKNTRGFNHGALFQSGDLRRRSTHTENSDQDIVEDEGFYRPLNLIVPRLELMGHTLEAAEREYERVAAQCLEGRRLYSEYVDEPFPADFRFMTFEEFRSFVASMAIETLDDTYDNQMDDDQQSRLSRRIFTKDQLDRIPNDEHFNDGNWWSERSLFGAAVSILHPYSMLRIFAENESNQNALVEWVYDPLVSAGWASADEFEAGVDRAKTYLVATEGSSDTNIISKAFELLRPDVSDFFRFIDVSQSHPFSGTGNLARFAEGLVKIDVHNQTLFLLDNDAEGLSASKKISKLTLPANMRVTTLPDLAEFEDFATIGPDGEATGNINGRAAAIECYLDFSYGKVPPPRVRWSYFKDDVGTYHGALEQKDRYARAFLKGNLNAQVYDTRKLGHVLDEIIGQCSAIATDTAHY